jgi:hypothetical protein
LKVTRVLGLLAVPDTKFGTANVHTTLLETTSHVSLHRICEDLKEVNLFYEISHFLLVYRLEIGNKYMIAGKI